MIVFAADFFASDLPGGAECNDQILIDHLSKCHDVKTIHCCRFDSCSRYQVFMRV